MASSGLSHTGAGSGGSYIVVVVVVVLVVFVVAVMVVVVVVIVLVVTVVVEVLSWVSQEWHKIGQCARSIHRLYLACLCSALDDALCIFRLVRLPSLQSNGE